MGQSELSCYRECGQPTTTVEQRSQQALQGWRSKRWGRIAPHFYQCDSKVLRKGLAAFSTSTLQSIRSIPEEHQQVVVNIKLMGYTFRDELFPHSDESIGLACSDKPNMEWKRARDIYPQAVLNSHEKLGFQHRGKISTRMTKLYTVFSLLSEFPEVMERMLTWPLTEEGIFGVTFFINGVKEEVIIDDSLPTINGRYYFGEPPVTDQLWPLLVEKALAKVLGNYFKIDNYTIQELFEQITGISADTTGTSLEYSRNSSPKHHRNHTKSLLLMLRNEAGSSHKLPTISTSSLSESRTQSEYQDEFIHLMRMPGYQISSIEMACHKREQSLYYRFRIPESARISLRVNQLLRRHFSDHIKESCRFGDVMIELARFDECSSNLNKLYEGGSTNQQKTYLEDRQFVDLIEGDYFLHVRICQDLHPAFQPPYSLVMYSSLAVCLRPILSINKAEQLKHTMLRQQYHRLLDEVVPSARGKTLSTNTVCTKYRVLLMITNHQQHSRRLKMTLLNRLLFFQDHQQQSQIILQVAGRSDHLVSLFLRDHRQKLDNRQTYYEIRVIP